VGTLALLAAETLVDSADVLGGLCCDALKGTDAAFDERIHKARPHSGQIKTAANLRKMLEGSQIRESHRECGRVQDAYSLRCIPQVHGAVRDTLAHCREVFEIERTPRWTILWSSSPTRRVPQATSSPAEISTANPSPSLWIFSASL